MAENVLETRIQLRYDTYDNWMSSSVILKAGEVAIAKFDNSSSINPSNSYYSATSAIGIKVGEGNKYFYQLPWLQGVAADVYNWAKAAVKPTYTAQEIQGLQSYIELYAPGGSGGEVTIAPRIYQIALGTDENANKYYLRYKENTEEALWILDTSHYIDLSDLVKIKSWLSGSDDSLREYPDLGTKIVEQVLITFNTINSPDEEVSNLFVTSVSLSRGFIQVTRTLPSFSNISGIATVLLGGTGRDSLPSGQVLVGNGLDTINTIPIATEITNDNALVPNYLIKQYVDSATNGITGAMHFIGESNVVINNGSSVNPNIIGYNFTRARAGDVILYEEKEFVWNGSSWQLLGDEGSYAVKGSIKNADIAEDAGIAQSKIANLEEDLNSKVDKIEGKGLSTNDYTTEEKDKLRTIEDGAQRNLIEHIFVNDREQVPTIINSQPNSIALSIDVFDEEHATKLDGIEAGAQANVIEHILINGTEILPTTVANVDKSVNLLLTLYTEAERQKLSNIEAEAQVNKVESITINGTTYNPNSNNKTIDITLDPNALNLTVLEGARYPSGNNEYTNIEVTNKKLELSHIAATGNIKDILQSNDEYITLYCGTSTDVI